MKPATLEEIGAAYRLLLGRDPDEEGLRGWQQMACSPEALARHIMASAEFERSIGA